MITTVNSEVYTGTELHQAADQTSLSSLFLFNAEKIHYMAEEAVWKLKYIFYFLLSTLTGFLTFAIFIPLARAGSFNPLFIVLNSLILIIIVFFSFTGHHEFVRNNFYTLVLLPVILIATNNIFVGWALNQLTTDFILFTSLSLGLVFFAHRTSIYQARLCK